jgi:hypothetical protein
MQRPEGDSPIFAAKTSVGGGNAHRAAKIGTVPREPAIWTMRAAYFCRALRARRTASAAQGFSP